MVKEAGERQGVVISAGGGAVIDERNLKALKKNGIIVCLTASAGTILKRTGSLKTRPLLNVEDPLKKIEELLKKREPFYKKSDFFVDTDALNIEEVVRNIIEISKLRTN